MDAPPKKKSEGIIEYLERLRPEVDEVIEKYIPRKASWKWLEFTFGKPYYAYSLKAAQEALIEPIWEILDRGGKRWRPILFLLVTEAVGGNIKEVKDFLIIPEVVHNGTLVIDDIEDQGELRRGKPCLHRIFGTDMALNAGNFMYYLPLLVLKKNKDKLSPEILVKVYENCIQEFINIHFGQGTDLYWHQGKADNITEKEYLQMCAFKTGCLSRMSVKMAVILAEGSDELAEELGRVAEAIGVAFQIQDDILDISLAGEERVKFGKSFGNDIKEGKRTLMVIHALKRANRKDGDRLIKILNKHTDVLKERKEAIAIINKYRSEEYAKKVAEQIVEKSWRKTEKLLPSSKAKERLKEFVYYLIERKV